jgi:hypothetical protein
LLRLPRVELRLVRQRSRGAVYHAEGSPFQLAGAHAHRRRPDERVGAPELPAERARFQGRVVRRIRRRLADRLQRPRAVLRPRRGLRRHHRDRRRRLRAPGQPIPPAPPATTAARASRAA